MTDLLPTIAAISTAPGMGAIACIRLSGRDAYKICNTVFKAKNNKCIEDQIVNSLCFGTISDRYKIIDEVLVARFAAPHSYTGEDIVEITCHGSVYIQQKIMSLLLSNGAQLAQPGEFTQRAFVNGKLDLSQAEAVADLISSSSAAAHRVAINQMRGGFSNELHKLRNELLDFTSLVELELDFSEEDVEFANREQLHNTATKIASAIKKLADSFDAGNAIKNGVPVAIVGETNAGKSTLLNLLLNEERAIVSDIHGTTRDVIEDTTVIEGITFRFIDTAGIRDTTDTIESIGIERTFQKLQQSTIILWVIDSLSMIGDIQHLAERIVPKAGGKKLVIVLNKVDLLDEHERNEKEFVIKNLSNEAAHVSISAIRQLHIEALKKHIIEAASLQPVGDNDIIVTNLRHYYALVKSYEAIQRVVDGLNNSVSGDFLSQDIRECIFHLGEITGDITTNDILGNIFSKFCIGK